MENIAKIIIVFFNSGMFNATGESDKPAIEIDLTEDQIELINKQQKLGRDVLSIHPVYKNF